MKAVPDQIGRFVPGPFIPLGTDGYGRSDTRVALRRHFEVNAASVTVAVLDGLARQDRLPRHVVAAAIEHHGVDTELPDPREVLRHRPGLRSAPRSLTVERAGVVPTGD